MAVQGVKVYAEDLLNQGFRRLGNGLFHGKEVYVKSVEDIARSADGEQTLKQTVDTLFAFVKDGVVTGAAKRNAQNDLVKHTATATYSRGCDHIDRFEDARNYLNQLYAGRMMPESKHCVTQTITGTNVGTTANTTVSNMQHKTGLLRNRWTTQKLDISDGDIQSYERTIENESNLISLINIKSKNGEKLNVFEKFILKLSKLRRESYINQNITYGNTVDRITGHKSKTLQSGKMYADCIDKKRAHSEAPLPRFSSLRQAFKEGSSNI